MVHGIGFGDHVPPRVASVGRDRGASARERTNPEDGVAQPQEAAEAASDAPANDSNSGSAQGVLRNLEAGHFSGVADVRDTHSTSPIRSWRRNSAPQSAQPQRRRPTLQPAPRSPLPLSSKPPAN